MEIKAMKKKWLSDKAEWYYEANAKKAIEQLERNNFTAFYFPTQKEAYDKIMAMIPEGARVGWGGSVTLYNMGILYELSKSSRYKYFNPFKGVAHGDTPLGVAMHEKGVEEYWPQMLDSLNTDVYLTSTNAITLDGELVNIDGRGNRVAAMLFGPKKVIVVAGANKIVKDVETARRRIKDLVAPLTARMLGYQTPCTKTGHCVPGKTGHCYHPHRICCATVVINGQYEKDRINVIIIGEDLGF